MTHSRAVHQKSIDRRQFLKAAAAAAAAVPAAYALGQGSRKSPKWKMKLSTSSLHYRSLPLTEACQRIGKLGFEGIDVWAHFEWAGPLCRHLEEGIEQLGAARFKALLKENNLSLFAASCYSVPIKKFAPLLDKMGGCVMIRGSQSLQGDPASVTLADLKAQMRQFLESLRPDVEIAEQHQCTVAIENHSGKSLLNSLDSIKLFAELNQHKHLGIALAPYHVQVNKESVEESIRSAADQLKFFYAWQHADATGQLPGIGPTDMGPWLQALADINYKGYVNPFMHHEPDPDEMDVALETSRTYLRKTYGEVFA